MFKVYRGRLLLEHPDVKRVLSKLMKKPLTNDIGSLKYQIKKFLYFYNNSEQILHPITLFLNRNKISGVHPGNYRFIASSFKKLNDMDCIFLIRGNESIFEYVKTISINSLEYDNVVFFKNSMAKSRNWWEVSTHEHQQFLNNHNNEYLIFSQELDYTLDAFLKLHKDYQWVYNNNIILKGNTPKYNICIKNTHDLFESIAALADQLPLATLELQIEKIKND
jgi:hypothetical protein